MSRFKRYLRLPGAEQSEVQDEIAYHIEAKTEQLIAEGMSAQDARAEALRQFGDRERIAREVGREVSARVETERRASLLDAFRQDVRFALRQLRAAPLFTFIAVATIALGIGATTAIFSVVRAVLLRPLPYQHAERIVLIGESDDPAAYDPLATTSFANYEDWARRATSFDAIGLFNGWSPTLTELGEPARLRGAQVTSGVFDALSLRPALGRPMRPEDNVPNAPMFVWISHGFWQARLGGAANVIGRTLTLNGRPLEIAGVLPAGYQGPGAELSGDVWLNTWRDTSDTRSSRYLNVIARLKPGVDIDRARSEMTNISTQMQQEYPKENATTRAVLFPLRDLVIGGRTRGPVMLLMLASVLVLLIACANTSNLLVARGSYRAREFALRTALGTTSARIVRQLLTESIVLGTFGAIAGVVLALVALRVIVGLAPEGIRAQNVRLDGLVLGFGICAAFASALLFGLLPALRARSNDVQQVLREDSRAATSSRARRLRSSLAVLQLALALALLLSAGLIFKSFAQVLQIDPGIRPHNILSMSMNLPGAKYQGEAIPRFTAELAARVNALPGVEDAAVTSIMPFGGSWDRTAVDTGSVRDLPFNVLPEGDRYMVGEGYFRTMGVPLRAGRTFTLQDRLGAAPVAVVDEVFARKLEPTGNVIGKRIGVPGADTMATVVGVVGHVKHYGLDATSGGQIYYPEQQIPWRWLVLAVRTEGDPRALVSAVRDVVRSIDPNQAVFDIATVDDLMTQRLAARRFVLSLLGAFAAVALVLAAIGLYGVIAYAVAQRRREFGIRLALGAGPSQLIGGVLREAALLVAIGSVAGIALAALSARLVGSFLFQVSPADPAVAVGAVALLTITAAAASWLPARRAARADPLDSLRS